MEPSIFKKFVNEFPFLTGIHQLAYQYFGERLAPTSIKVSRLSEFFVKQDIPEDAGRPMQLRETLYPEISCYQIFAVKNDIVGELTSFDPNDPRPYGYSDNGDGTYDWYLYEPCFEMDFFEPGDKYDFMPVVKWGILSLLRGDEDYLVTVEYKYLESIEDDEDLYSQIITIYKPPKHGSLSENIKAWEKLESVEEDRLVERWLSRTASS